MVGVRDLFRVSKNTTQFMERVGRASSQNQALRRWNFCFLLDIIEKVGKLKLR